MYNMFKKIFTKISKFFKIFINFHFTFEVFSAIILWCEIRRACIKPSTVIIKE